MKKIFNLFFLLFSMVSCYHSAPEPDYNMKLVLPADSMITLLADLHLAEGIISTLKSEKKPVDHISSEYFEAVLRNHSVSRETFEESMRYYAFHTEELDEIYEQVITGLSKRESLYRADSTMQEPVE